MILAYQISQWLQALTLPAFGLFLLGCLLMDILGNKITTKKIEKMSESKSSSSSIGFMSILALIFITLKLCGVITWSWWWVTAPIWGGVVLVVLLVALVFFITSK